MKELAKRFIGKKCIIIAFDGSRQYDGVVREVSDNALLLEKNGQLEALNLDFVMKIKEQLEKKKRKQ